MDIESEAIHEKHEEIPKEVEKNEEGQNRIHSNELEENRMDIDEAPEIQNEPIPSHSQDFPTESEDTEMVVESKIISEQKYSEENFRKEEEEGITKFEENSENILPSESCKPEINLVSQEESKSSVPLPQISPAEEILRSKFNYYYDLEGVLRNTESNETFKFVNQRHYEDLGDVIQKYIQEQMVSKYEMIEKWLPSKKNYPKGPYCNIFLSKNWKGPCQKLLLLIQGAGAVRAGMWARSVCINDSLNTGSIFPFLTFAKEEGYEVVVFNPNYNRDPQTGQSILCNESLEAHGNYVWKNFIRKNKAEELYIVAHSCGGLSTMSLAKHFWEEFKERVKGVAFTDAVHGYYGMDREKLEFFRRRAVDWVASGDPLDTLQRSYDSSVIFVSSGHRKHEYTTGSAYPSIFKFLRVINERNPYLL